MIKTELEVEKIIQDYKSIIGKDFFAYKNHVIRTIKLALKLKRENQNDDEIKLIIAAVHHDIGIWTENTFDYILPSIKKASSYLSKIDKQDWIEEISLIIEMHHKRSVYKGKFSDNVESFRRADLIDITKNGNRFGVKKEVIQNLYTEFPVLGFRKMLAMKFFKNLLKNPFNPLPMLKK